MILVSCTDLSPVFDRCSRRVLCSGAGNGDSRAPDLSSWPSLLAVLVVYCVLEPGTMILVSCTDLSPVFDRCSRHVLCSGAGNDDSRVTDLSPRPSVLDVLVVYGVLEPGTMIPLPCPVIQFTLTSLLIASAVQVCLLACSDQFAFPLVLVSGTGCELPS